MPAIVTFDAVNRRIVEISAGGADNTLDIVEIYSEWKEWVKLAENASAPPAFRQVGGDPITASLDLGTTFFLLNRWKIRPSEENHKLTIVGNLWTDPPGESAFVATLGSFSVNTETRVSNLVDSAVARLDLAQLQEAIYIDTINGASGTLEGIGTPTNPVDNLADAVTIATRENLRAFSIVGSITLDRAFSDWRFMGTVSKESASINLAGYVCTRCSFEEISLAGNAGGASLTARSCGLDTLSNCVGEFTGSGLTSVFSAGSGGKLTFVDCYSDVPGASTATIDLADNLADDCQFRGWIGGITFSNIDTAGQNVSVDVLAGNVVLDATCVDGTVVIRGDGTLTDNSGPGCDVTKDGLNNPRAVWDVVLP